MLKDTLYRLTKPCPDNEDALLNPQSEAEKGLSRRRLLKWTGTSFLSLAPLSWMGFSGKVGGLFSGDMDGEITPPNLSVIQKGEKTLNFYNVHTGEFLKKCVFWANGKFDPGALKNVDRLFRDHRTNKVHSIDYKLLNLLHNITQKLGTQKPIHLVSGYRCLETNNRLRLNDGYGVAKHSQHTLGRAADIFIEGHSLRKIGQIALNLKSGGVGRYDSFVHVDTGRIRRWGRMA
ncbi:MAG: DUF882 domain-containing protein [Alphaproteobacteria bacterium]|nr:DUF882 domain-containing protein [Alphaproteobacteria bacterium]